LPILKPEKTTRSDYIPLIPVQGASAYVILRQTRQQSSTVIEDGDAVADDSAVYLQIYFLHCYKTSNFPAIFA